MINFLLGILIGSVVGRAVELWLDRKYNERVEGKHVDPYITLLTHITDGGAVYLTDDHNFRNATIIIRLDGGEELIRCVTEDEVLALITKLEKAGGE